MNIKKNLILACFMGLFAAACQKEVYSLNGNTYRMVQKLGAPVEIIIGFDEQENRFAGKVLNRYFGSYEITEPDTIVFGPTGTTMMAGPEDVMKAEQEYLQFLNNVRNYKITQTTLELSTPEGESRTFEKISSQEQTEE